MPSFCATQPCPHPLMVPPWLPSTPESSQAALPDLWTPPFKSKRWGSFCHARRAPLNSSQSQGSGLTRVTLPSYGCTPVP